MPIGAFKVATFAKLAALPAPTYAIAAAGGATSVNEGSSLTFNVTGTNIVDGTYYWTVTNSGDFATSSGSFTITSNAGSFSVTPTADATAEGAETFTASVRTTSTSGTIVATSSSITINDTSDGPQNAVLFDGTGDFYEASFNSTAATNFSYYTTIVGYIRPQSTSQMNLLQVQLGTTSGYAGLNLTVWDNGGLLLTQPDNSGADNATVYANYNPGANVWQHFMLYIDWNDFNNCRFYLDGVNRTSTHLLNGPSFGERGVDGQYLRWGNPSSIPCKVNIGGFFAFTGARDVNDYNGKIAYLWVGSQPGAPDIGNFWDSTGNKPWPLASNGTVNGLTPRLYHYGDSSTFAVNNASLPTASYTLTANGNVTSTSGQTYSSNSFTAPSNGTVSYITSSTSTTTTWTIPATAQAGDIAILFHTSGTGVETVPTGWSPLTNTGQSVTGIRQMACYKIVRSGEPGTTVSNAVNGGKICLIFRPSKSVTYVSSNSVSVQPTAAVPTNQVFTPSLAEGTMGNFPIIVFANYCANGAITTRGWSGGTPTEVTATTSQYVKFLIYNSNGTPVSTTISMNDAGTNCLSSGYLRIK